MKDFLKSKRFSRAVIGFAVGLWVGLAFIYFSGIVLSDLSSGSGGGLGVGIIWFYSIPVIILASVAFCIYLGYQWGKRIDFPLVKEQNAHIEEQKSGKFKKSIIYTFILFVFIAGFIIIISQQYSIYQKNISCGGDWSYNVRCPIGSHCQSLGQGPLAGGICKPFLSPLFGVFSRLQQSEKPQQSPAGGQSGSTTEKIVSSEVTLEGCKVKVTTTKKDIFLDTNFLQLNPQIKCYQFLLNQVSPSGKYVVFQNVNKDTSGGFTNTLMAYDLDYNNAFKLGTYGNWDNRFPFSILNIGFLPDDKLITLYGYKYDENTFTYQEQYLDVFDIPGLFSTYPSNISKQDNSFTNLSQYWKRTTLPNIGKEYYDFLISNGKVEIYGTGGFNTEVLKEYNIDDILPMIKPIGSYFSAEYPSNFFVEKNDPQTFIVAEKEWEGETGHIPEAAIEVYANVIPNGMNLKDWLNGLGDPTSPANPGPLKSCKEFLNSLRQELKVGDLFTDEYLKGDNCIYYGVGGVKDTVIADLPAIEFNTQNVSQATTHTIFVYKNRLFDIYYTTTGMSDQNDHTIEAYKSFLRTFKLSDIIKDADFRG